jgi:hypothetical protein
LLFQLRGLIIITREIPCILVPILSLLSTVGCKKKNGKRIFF